LKFEADIFKAPFATEEMLWSTLDGVNLDLFLKMLSAFDQEKHKEKHKSTISPLDCDNSKLYWVFRNMDFQQWSSASCPHVLRLSGPPECGIHQASSRIVDIEKEKALEKQHSVLYFFC